MRFLHLADVHLDTSFSGRSPEVRTRLREASRRAFRRAVDLAIREEVRAFLIAGDLFDGDRLSFQTERFLLEQMARLEAHHIVVVYATGNHDPGAPDAGPRRIPWPANVHVAAGPTPQRITIPDPLGEPVGFVTAIGHATAQVSDDLSRLLPRPQGELPEVALLHTQVRASAASDEHGPYAPSELGYLTRAGYDYWALGHVHRPQILAEDPPVVYPGSLQGKSFGEDGPRGAYLVDLEDRDAPALSFRPLAPVRWVTLEVTDLEEADSLDRLETAVQRAWGAGTGARGRNGTEWMIRVVLKGATPLWRELARGDDTGHLAEELTGLLGALEVVVDASGVHPPLDLSEHRGRTDVLGEALRLLSSLQSGEEPVPGLERGDLAGTPSGGGEETARYVRSLIEDADAELAALLLGLKGGNG